MKVLLLLSFFALSFSGSLQAMETNVDPLVELVNPTNLDIARALIPVATVTTGISTLADAELVTVLWKTDLKLDLLNHIMKLMDEEKFHSQSISLFTQALSVGIKLYMMKDLNELAQTFLDKALSHFNVGPSRKSYVPLKWNGFLMPAETTAGYSPTQFNEARQNVLSHIDKGQKALGEKALEK